MLATVPLVSEVHRNKIDQDTEIEGTHACYNNNHYIFIQCRVNHMFPLEIQQACMHQVEHTACFGKNNYDYFRLAHMVLQILFEMLSVSQSVRPSAESGWSLSQQVNFQRTQCW